MSVFEILANLLKIAASPGGEAVLSKIFAEHSLSVESMNKIVAALKDPPALNPLPPS